MVQLYVPNPIEVKAIYETNLKTNNQTPFPFWSQIWASAIAITKFIDLNPIYIENKKVLELGAGLGLPSLFAAQKAAYVCCTDTTPQAIHTVQQSIKHNKLVNIGSNILDWNNLVDIPQGTQVVLMSDVNYNQYDFEPLLKLIKLLLSQHITIILSTPQRLQSKKFIAQLLGWCTHQEEIQIESETALTVIHILVLATT